MALALSFAGAAVRADVREDGTPGQGCPVAAVAAPGIDDRCGGFIARDQAPTSPMAHVRVRDQGNTNTCYAHTAVEQVDAWRFSHGDTHYEVQSSAMAAAIGAGASDLVAGHWSEPHLDFFGRRTDTEIGENENVLEYLQRRANVVCDQRYVQVATPDGRRITAVDSRYIANLTNYFNAYREWSRRRDAFFDARSAAIPASPHAAADVHALRESDDAARLAERQRLATELVTCLQGAGLPPGLVPDAQTVAMLFEQQNPLVFQRDVISAACTSARGGQPRVVIPDFQYSEDGLARLQPAQSFERLSRLLDSQTQPVQTMICDHMLQNPDYTGMLNHGNGSQAGNCGGHSVLLIGRRMHCGKCQFLIRNSWGMGCAANYARSHVVSCDSVPNQGDAWVNADAFSDNTYWYSYLHE